MRPRTLTCSAWRKLTVTSAIFGLMAALAPGLTHSAESQVHVIQPRSYGHVLGDILTQRVSLDSAAGRTEVPVLPVAARVNVWFERLPARIETDAQRHTWLRIDYQVVNAPRDLELAALPSLKIEMKSGNTATVPEWPVSIGSLTPVEVFGKGDLQSMRPDHVAAPYDTGHVRRQLQLWAVLSSLLLAAWLGWFFWRNLRDANRMPFARAVRELRRLGRRGEAQGPAGWIFLHRAFNDAAGRVVQPESLPALFAKAPYLIPLRPEIERFYQASSERFFAPTPVSSSLELNDLSRRLRSAEKRRGSSRVA